ncbi:uncharacterized protein F5Z01DRAFT_27956 [Emericellopsis atlantica]|uniref:Uncharacterized protein n=1 Tax=Emericellopsis atlantica TaxID=2614577 RepID=A0A9P7ZVK8_9HYPO|nr:uncharacterized protein F5Z01DRAFT_27956 [Emericellopsis atlantica]KAG9259174.1 hypothetical protein F5Z01DRAFT_27956 [Emericellopsis atlantica]
MAALAGLYPYVHLLETVLMWHRSPPTSLRAWDARRRGRAGPWRSTKAKGDRDQGLMYMAAWPQRDVAGGGGAEKNLGGQWVSGWVRAACAVSHPAEKATRRSVLEAESGTGLDSLMAAFRSCGWLSRALQDLLSPPSCPLVDHEELLLTITKVKQTLRSVESQNICLFHRERADASWLQSSGLVGLCLAVAGLCLSTSRHARSRCNVRATDWCYNGCWRQPTSSKTTYAVTLVSLLYSEGCMTPSLAAGQRSPTILT